MEENKDMELEALMQEPPSGEKKKKKKSKRRKKIIIAAAVLLIFIVGIINVLGAGQTPAVMVTTTALRQGAIQNKIALSGPVSGTDSAEVVSNLHAEIEEILVKEGDKVTKGQVLARLNPEDVERDVAIAQNAYQLAVANYEDAQREAVNGYAKAKQDYSAARDNYSRTSTLYQAGDISRVDYETALNTMNDAKRSMESYTLENGEPVASQSYSLQVRNAEFELQQKQKRLEETEIVSPIAGTVVRVNSRVGRFADVVDDDKPLFAIDNLEALELKINVSEYSIGKIEIGQKAVIRADIIGKDQTEEGIVASISPTGEEKGGGSTERVIPITIQILNPDTGLIAGITGKAELVLEEETEALIVPVSAVYQMDDQIMIAAAENGVVRLIPVITGIESDIEVQVFGAEGSDAGLQADMRIITNPSAELYDGQQVLEQPVG